MSGAPTAPLLLTPGEPAGIGPELAIKLAQQKLPQPLVAVADPHLLRNCAKRLGLPVRIHPLDRHALQQKPLATDSGTLYVLPVPLRSPVTVGHLNPENSPYVLDTLDLAATLCLNGEADALITGPVHKGVINDAGIAFRGHTEYLATRSGVDQVVMMLASQQLRVALATTHLPLRHVPQALTRPHLRRVLQILIEQLRSKFAIDRPKILVAGLNPHAGEDGHLGSEEIDIIRPVLHELRHSPATLIGPLPADTLFTPPQLAGADAVLAMYHDQGLPVLKHLGFGSAVNITLGLPFIRTSVDHGTALDIATTGHADSGSLRAAITTAASLAATRHSPRPTPDIKGTPP